MNSRRMNVENTVTQDKTLLTCYCCSKSKPAEAFREYPLLLCWVCKREIVKWKRKQKFRRQISDPTVKIATGGLCPRCGKEFLEPRQRVCKKCKLAREKRKNHKKYAKRVARSRQLQPAPQETSL